MPKHKDDTSKVTCPRCNSNSIADMGTSMLLRDEVNYGWVTLHPYLCNVCLYYFNVKVKVDETGKPIEETKQ